MKIKLLKFFAVALLSFAAISGARSEPTSGPVIISALRPYSGSNWVYLTGKNPPGSFCATSFYVIDLSSNGGKGMYAAALTALATGKSVQLEIAGCGTGPAGGNLLQSLTVLNSPP